jgi:hypothetical protein
VITVAEDTPGSVTGGTVTRRARDDDVVIEQRPQGPDRRRSTMAEKQIQPKAAGTESAKSTTAAAGVQKKSLKKLSHKKTAKKVAKRSRNV